jgi:PDZ domain-containing secreted protein
MAVSALIRAVAEDSPAAAAGLSERDVITAIDGEAVNHPRDLIDAVARRQPGDTIILTVAKPEDDISQEVTITLADHPDQAGKAYLGVQVSGFFRLKRSEDDSSIEQDIEIYVNPQAMLEELPLELELPRKELNVTPQPKGDVCHLTS